MSASPSVSLFPARLALPLAAVTLFAACASEPPPPPRPPIAATTSSAPAAANAKGLDGAKASSTESSVHVDASIVKACGLSDDDAYFGFDSAQLTGATSRPLDAVAKCFVEGPLAGRALTLIGHADPRGDGDYNFALAQRRADAVAGYLGSKGLPAGRASTTSRGAMDAQGSDESGWARDRRVDLVLVR